MSMIWKKKINAILLIIKRNFFDMYFVFAHDLN